MKKVCAAAASLIIVAVCFGQTPPAPAPPAQTPAPPAPSADAGAPLAPPAAPVESLRYTVLLMERPVGTMTVSVGADGVREYAYEYNDRGRGPKLASKIKLDNEGVPVSIETTGVDYLKNPVEETFSMTGPPAALLASWKNRGDQGERTLAKKSFYLSLDGVPDELALLAAVLKDNPRGRVEIVPEGQARVDRAGEPLEVTVKGETRAVQQFTIANLDFSPLRVWLDPERRLFAIGDSWQALVREGWEPAWKEVLEAQNEAEDARTEEISKLLHRRPPAGAVFLGVRLFDAATGEIKNNTTVVVNGNRIEAIGPDGKVSFPPGAQLIDARGKLLMPGLWDMHAHVQDAVEGAMHLAAGVTTVRDLANDTDRLIALKRQFDAGNLAGPRILLAGFIDGRGEYAGPTKVYADNEMEAKAAIEKYAARGHEQIKIYSSIKPELVPAIVSAAHAKGLRVSGHVPAFMTAQQFVEAGADEIQHANFLFLNFLPEAKDTRTPLRFTAVAEQGAELDLSSAKVTSFIQLLRERKTVIDPTLNIFEGLFTDRAGQIPTGMAQVARRLPPLPRRGLLEGGLPVPDGKDQRYRDSFSAMVKMVGALEKAGVTVVPGTDNLPGFALHRELELYAQAGIPAKKVLQMATLGAAKVMKREKEYGSIAKGKYADFILIDGDPTVNISDIRKVTTIVKDGAILQSNALYQTIGIEP